MFDLEEKISEWRKQMLAAGIKSPVPLDELEIHLREEIERQMKSGADEQTAFGTAIAQIGWAEPLKAEFKKAGGFLNWLGQDNAARIRRGMALLWLAYCSWAFFALAKPILGMFYGLIVLKQGFGLNLTIPLVLFMLVIYFRGILASLQLFSGKGGDRMIRLIAILGLVALVAQLIHFHTVSPMGIILSIFNLVSLLLLRPLNTAKRATN